MAKRYKLHKSGLGKEQADKMVNMLRKKGYFAHTENTSTLRIPFVPGDWSVYKRRKK